MSIEALNRHNLAKQVCNEEFIINIFIQGRSFRHWTSREVEDSVLGEIYDLARWSPSAVNQWPLRVTFIKSAEAKAKLIPCVMDSNVREVTEAPVVAILSTDLDFWKHLETLGGAKFASRYVDDAVRAKNDGTYNANILAGFFMLAARVKGVDIHPMGGWSRTRVDEAFHAGTDTRKSWNSFLLCTMGYADRSEGKVQPRQPRLPFESANVIFDCRPSVRQSKIRFSASANVTATLEAKESASADEATTALTISDLQLARENVLFRAARSYTAYQPNTAPMHNFGVSQLKKIYDLAKLYPSIFNCTPLRVAYIFAPSQDGTLDDEAKDTANHQAYSILMGSLAGGNVEATKTAPLVAVIAADTTFVNKFDVTNPGWDAASYFNESRMPMVPEIASTNALYGFAWLVMAVRAMGLDCGPMGGFDKEKAAAMFLPKDGDVAEDDWRDPRTKGWKPLILLKIGTGDETKVRPRCDRLPFEIACSLL